MRSTWRSRQLGGGRVDLALSGEGHRGGQGVGGTLWPIMQEGEDVVWGVHGIHGVFLKVITVALSSHRKVSLLSCLDILKVDGDKAVSVRPCILMDEAESMNQLVNWSHEAFSETATAEVHILDPTDPSHLAFANIESVSNENVVLSHLCRLFERDAVFRDLVRLVFDIVHRFPDNPPVVFGEGVVELELKDTIRPQLIRVGNGRVLTCF